MRVSMVTNRLFRAASTTLLEVAPNRCSRMYCLRSLSSLKYSTIFILGILPVVSCTGSLLTGLAGESRST